MLLTVEKHTCLKTKKKKQGPKLISVIRVCFNFVFICNSSV